ncbi:mitochondrial ADP, ATP carrier protein [Melampsora americana]|nr:mitochondrial ADP, ATP carrier protein [Melampsora americana]
MATNQKPSKPKSTSDLTILLKSGLAGGIAGCVAKTIVSPLDRVKILFQTAHPQFSHHSGSITGVFGAIRQIYSSVGFLGLVQGHSATLLRIFPYAAIKFMAYDSFHNVLIPIDLRDQPPSSRLFMAGALSGITAVFFTYPLDLLRVRLAFETKQGASRVKILETIREIYTEPVKVGNSSSNRLFNNVPFTKFYRGFTPTLSGMIPYAGTSFLVWGTLQSKLLPNQRSSNTMLNLLCGSVAGLISQTASYPFEIIRRKMQIGGLGLSPDMNMSQVARQIFVTDGFRGFFVGLSIGYLKVIPMTAISFVTWSTLKIRFE